MNEQSVTVRGPEGKLYWGYFLVGTLQAWTATRSFTTGVGSLTATIDDVDTDRIDTARDSQLPVVCVVTHQHGVWRWPLESLQIADKTLTASICSPGK